MERNVDGGSWRSSYLVNCRISIFLTAALVCVLFGGFLGFRWDVRHMALENNKIEYGISGQDLHVRSVEWKDCPAWREVTFSVDGSISFITEQNGSITFDNHTNQDVWVETQREHNVSTNGKDLIYYDDVTYMINDGVVSAMIPKIYDGNMIIDVVRNSFYFVFHEKDSDYIAGSIYPLDTEYKVWTEEENNYYDTNMDTYLSAYTLSGTYDDAGPLHEKTQKEGVVLRKEEGNFLNCTVYNNGSDVWNYEAHLPHVELWYKGVWIELTSPFAYNLMTMVIEPGQNREFDVPKETIIQYPTLIDGIYRLVIYGENEEFAVSDTFIVEG